MKYLTKHLLALVFMALSLNLNAQKVTPLKIGDTVPDIVLEKMLNHTSSSGKLSDFAGKAIIIDQWFIGCVPCVTAMPHLDSLQKEFATELQILPVTFEKKSDVDNFWSNNILVKGISFTQVVEDTLVRAFFPAISFPHQVWINKERKVVAITNGSSATKVNIKKLVNSEKLSLHLKSDEMDPDVRRAKNPNILVRYEQNIDKLLQYSYFSKFRKEFASYSFSELDTVNGLVRILCNNLPMFKLYDLAYSNNSWEMRHMPTRFIRKDTSPIKGRNTELADTIHLFCYELIHKGLRTDAFNKYMIHDLDNFFNIKSHEEWMDISCFIISPNGKGNRYRNILQPDRKSYQTISLTRAKKVVINDVALFLVERTINLTSKAPVLLEVPGKGKISFDVTWNTDDLKTMNEELSKFDLKISQEYRRRKVIVLEDK